jgi:hypothetical protein
MIYHTIVVSASLNCALHPFLDAPEVVIEVLLMMVTSGQNIQGNNLTSQDILMPHMKYMVVCPEDPLSSVLRWKVWKFAGHTYVSMPIQT